MWDKIAAILDIPAPPLPLFISSTEQSQNVGKLLEANRRPLNWLGQLGSCMPRNEERRSGQARRMSKFMQGKRFDSRSLDLSTASSRDHLAEAPIVSPRQHIPPRKRRSIKAQFFSPPHKYLPVDWDKFDFVPRMNWKLSSRWVKARRSSTRGGGVVPVRSSRPLSNLVGGREPFVRS